jgi:hypothetical protein
MQIWYQVYFINYPAMSGCSHTTQTLKDMKKRDETVKGLDPNDPNNAAFKLVT